MNLPIKRIVFLETQKFDGTEVRPLKASEVQQIAGRAGRQGIFDVGYYTSMYDKKDIQKKLEKAIPNATQAVLGFSSNLVSIEGKLSEIMTRWLEMADKPLYKKADLDEQLALCLELEALTDDKNLIYQFITIPFDPNHQRLHLVWRECFQYELNGKHKPFEEFLCTPSDLDSMENAYKYYDLLYFYYRRFGVHEHLAHILQLKSDISAQIAKLLSEKELAGKRCRNCKKKLPWNYPYGLCEDCYNRQRHYRRYDYYDDFDDIDDIEDWL